MKLHQIVRRINIAIDTLRVNDNYLLKNDVNERSITHKLAIYLEQTFGKTYDIDCEYNRNINDPKKIIILEHKWDELNNRIGLSDEECQNDIFIEKSVFPDIVIHKRGKTNRNLLIIEVKKSTSTVSVDYDIEKLKCYTDTDNILKYNYGVLIKLHTSKEKFQYPDMKYFSEGKEIPISTNYLSDI